MGRRNPKYLYLILATVLLIGLVGLAGCPSDTSGTNDSGGSGSSSASGYDDTPVDATVDQLTAGIYSGRSVVFNGYVGSNTGSYIMIGSIKIVPQDPTCLESIRSGDQVEVKGYNTGLSGGVVMVSNAEVAPYCGDEGET
jgi:hypothetical protein